LVGFERYPNKTVQISGVFGEVGEVLGRVFGGELRLAMADAEGERRGARYVVGCVIEGVV